MKNFIILLFSSTNVASRALAEPPRTVSIPAQKVSCLPPCTSPTLKAKTIKIMGERMKLNSSLKTL